MFMDQDLQLCDDTPRELQDAAAVPKASPKRRAAKAKAEGKAAKGKREARATTGSAPCLADGCSDPRVSNTKWCKSHKRSYDAMLYQATKEEEQHPGTLEIFKTTMANDYNASMEVAQFAEENPPDKMYAKKKFIDWARFRTVYGKTISNTDRNKTKPMWKGQFLLWAKNIMALDDEEGEEWWNELEQNPAIKRDRNGRKGRLQLYIPNFITRFTDRATFVTHQQEQGNKTIQKPTPENMWPREAAKAGCQRRVFAAGRGCGFFRAVGDCFGKSRRMGLEEAVPLSSRRQIRSRRRSIWIGSFPSSHGHWTKTWQT